MGGDDRDPSGLGAAPPTGFPEAFTNSFRGLMLGMMLGDIRNPGPGLLNSGPSMHQVCWTLDGLVRYHLSMRAAGHVLSPDSFERPTPLPYLREALLRWGASSRNLPRQELLDGWLAELPALEVDRGPTPVEDVALAELLLAKSLAGNDCRGPSALPRVLAMAACAIIVSPDRMGAWCAAAAGLTHGHPEAWSTALVLGIMAGGHLAQVYRSGPWVTFDPLPAVRWLALFSPTHPLLDQIVPAVDDVHGWSPTRLAELSPEPTAASVLAGALYLARHARDAQPAEIRALAVSAGDPHTVAALASALIGLEKGTRWLDVRELSRHELAWPMDALARDCCLTLWSPPHEEGAADALDEMTRRYPVARPDPPQC